MKKIVPTPGFFLVKIKLFFNYISQIQNIPVARYQYGLGIHRQYIRQLAYAIFLLRQIYPAVGS